MTPRDRFTVMAMLVALALVGVATVIGVVTFWPEERQVVPPEQLRRASTEPAEVIAVERSRCAETGPEDCHRVTAELTGGTDAGERVTFSVVADEVELTVGDRIRVFETPVGEGTVIAGMPVDRYGFSDFERRRPLLLLAIAFAALVVLTGRFQGLRALAGLGGSLLVIVFFVVPAILDGKSPTGVALFGALAVMLITIPLAHGLGPKMVAACLGTTAALLLTLQLADLFTRLAHLTGTTSDEAMFLRATHGGVSLQGLVIAGMVIGALGVLDDLTVSQSSTVMALRHANPALGFGELFRRALAVGHDHIAATVNTLALAYAGASLPVLLVFSLADTGIVDAIEFQAVAEAVVAMLVGSIGLVAAVPVTTALAALLATSLPPDDLEDEAAHVHVH